MKEKREGKKITGKEKTEDKLLWDPLLIMMYWHNKTYWIEELIRNKWNGHSSMSKVTEDLFYPEMVGVEFSVPYIVNLIIETYKNVSCLKGAVNFFE